MIASAPGAPRIPQPPETVSALRKAVARPPPHPAYPAPPQGFPAPPPEPGAETATVLGEWEA